MAVLLDTHSWVWSLVTSPRLTHTAATAMANAGMITVSPISIYEIAQKVRLGKWPELDAHVAGLETAAVRQGFSMTPFTPQIALRAGLLDWPHRDPFDRMLAATALVAGMALISADPVFDAVPGLRRIW